MQQIVLLSKKHIKIYNTSSDKRTVTTRRIQTADIKSGIKKLQKFLKDYNGNIST